MAGNINDYLRNRMKRMRPAVKPPMAAMPAPRPLMSTGTGNPAVDTPVLQQAIDSALVEQQMAANQAMLEDARRRQAGAAMRPAATAPMSMSRPRPKKRGM